VNGTSLLGATHLEAVRSLRGIGEDLTLLVCDGFDPAQVPAGQQAWMASPVASINSGRTQSEESLDREVIVPPNERAYEDIRKEIKRQVGGVVLIDIYPIYLFQIIQRTNEPTTSTTQWLHFRISSTDSKVRTTLYSIINSTA